MSITSLNSNAILNAAIEINREATVAAYTEELQYEHKMRDSYENGFEAGRAAEFRTRHMLKALADKIGLDLTELDLSWQPLCDDLSAVGQQIRDAHDAEHKRRVDAGEIVCYFGGWYEPHTWQGQAALRGEGQSNW